MQPNTISGSDINHIANNLSIDPEFIESHSPFRILGKDFKDILTFNGNTVLTDIQHAVGITGNRPNITGKVLLKGYHTHIEHDELHIKHDGKHWAYSLYNFPHVDGVHRSIRSTNISLESYLVMEIVSDKKCLYWVIAPLGDLT